MEQIKDTLNHLPTSNTSRVSESPSTNERFNCDKCRDLGVVHPLVDGKVDYSQVIACSCQIPIIVKERTERYLKRCHLPANIEHYTFENFKTYGNERLSLALKYAQELAEGREEIKWLTLFGKVDRGKTHLAVATCRCWLERGKAARYAFVPLLLNELRSGYDLKGEQSYSQTFDFLCRVDLLVLDDLAVEKATPWAREQLQIIVHYRGINGLPLMITTNRPIDDLGEIDPERRISSRLQRESFCRSVYLNTKEHRIEEAENA